MIRKVLFVALAVNLAFGLGVQGCKARPKCGFTPTRMRALPCVLHGVTIDNANGIRTTELNRQAAALMALRQMPTTRIVFDERTSPSGYVNAVNRLHPISYLMGELLDSSYIKTLTTAQYRQRTQEFLSAFASKIDIWEIGNEVNGNWTGNYADVGAKITAAFDVVEAARKRSGLTLWYNAGCGNGPSELSPEAFSAKYVPAHVRANVDYVTVSYYETQCRNIRPSAATLKSFFQRLHAIYPSARLGFGELGIPKPVTKATVGTAQSIVSYYYRLKIGLPYYAGFYGWWYFAEDAVPASKPMWQTLQGVIL